MHEHVNKLSRNNLNFLIECKLFNNNIIILFNNYLIIPNQIKLY